MLSSAQDGPSAINADQVAEALEQQEHVDTQISRGLQFYNDTLARRAWLLQPVLKAQASSEGRVGSGRAPAQARPQSACSALRGREPAKTPPLSPNRTSAPALSSRQATLGRPVPRPSSANSARYLSDTSATLGCELAGASYGNSEETAGQSVSSSLAGVLSGRGKCSGQARRCGSPTPLSEVPRSKSQASQRARSAPRTVNGVRTAELMRTTQYDDLSPAEQAAAEATAKTAAAAEADARRLKAEKIRSWLKRKDKEMEAKKSEEMEVRRRLEQKSALEELKKLERQREVDAQRARRLDAAERRRTLLRLQVQQACEGVQGQCNRGHSLPTAYAVPRPPVAPEPGYGPSSKPPRPRSASRKPTSLQT